MIKQLINKYNNWKIARKARIISARRLGDYLGTIGEKRSIIMMTDIVMKDGGYDYRTHNIREKHKPTWNRNVEPMTPFKIYVKNRQANS